jgi:hypothetical protein
MNKFLLKEKVSIKIDFANDSPPKTVKTPMFVMAVAVCNYNYLLFFTNLNFWSSAAKYANGKQIKLKIKNTSVAIIPIGK